MSQRTDWESLGNTPSETERHLARGTRVTVGRDPEPVLQQVPAPPLLRDLGWLTELPSLSFHTPAWAQSHLCGLDAVR